MPSALKSNRTTGSAEGSSPDQRIAARGPVISQWLLNWFQRYAIRYARRHFHAVRMSRADKPRLTGAGPVVVYLNHASWWDPLICLVLKNAIFPQRSAYAPIEAAQLQRYTFFSRLGFFGVERGTTQAGLSFLRTARALLNRPNSMLWLTPQGRFCDVRQRPAIFEEGIAWLSRHEKPVTFLPLALEYTFWNDRLPEVLVRFGKPLTQDDLPPAEAGMESIARALAGRLESTQTALATEAMTRDSARFQTLLQGGNGVGLLYDGWRWLKSRFTGQPFHRDHQA